MSGGAGNDRLVGGWGIDTMAGGAGNDTFVFTDVDVGTGVRDTITDFRAGDKIDLSSIDASLLTIGDDAFRLVAANTAFTSDFGEVHAVQVNGNTIIEGHLAGHTDIDFQIQLSGLQTITATSFVL